MKNEKTQKNFATRHNAAECVFVSLEKSVNARVSAEVYDRLRTIAASRLGGVKPSQIVREILEQAMIDGVLSQQRHGSPPANPTKVPQKRVANG
jgi:hypothetical protein